MLLKRRVKLKSPSILLHKINERPEREKSKQNFLETRAPCSQKLVVHALALCRRQFAASMATINFKSGVQISKFILHASSARRFFGKDKRDGAI